MSFGSKCKIQLKKTHETEITVYFYKGSKYLIFLFAIIYIKYFGKRWRYRKALWHLTLWQQQMIY